eukprot:TRINITY_DN12421_c1_g4_i1.p1 TRINITY_DN12421_c1_g4~~TRINITY_DN12421_c1_g4_i1.p1  ORF type:complete len:218 (+),score=21.57 TRINITY_DN12421_c1_g4_i1:541-1194(+)
MLACKYRHLELVDILIQRGVNLNAVNKFGGTALAYAAKHQNTAVLERLVAAGANVNAGWQKPLFEAVRHGSVRAVELLLEAGADVTARDKLEHTALHLTMQRGDSSVSYIASLLIAARGDPMAIGKNGDTPLHISYNTQVSMATSARAVLVRAGADPHCRNKLGQRLVVQNATCALRDIVLPPQWSGLPKDYFGSFSRCINHSEHEFLRRAILKYNI